MPPYGRQAPTAVRNGVTSISRQTPSVTYGSVASQASTPVRSGKSTRTIDPIMSPPVVEHRPADEHVPALHERPDRREMGRARPLPSLERILVRSILGHHEELHRSSSPSR